MFLLLLILEFLLDRTGLLIELVGFLAFVSQLAF